MYIGIIFISDTTEILSDFDIDYIVNTSTSSPSCHTSDKVLLQRDFLIDPCFLWCSAIADPGAWILLDMTEMFYISGFYLIQGSMVTIYEFAMEYTFTDPDTWMTYINEMIVEVFIYNRMMGR